MLNYMRQNAGSRLIKGLLLAIAASFIIGFGFLPSLGGSPSGAYAAKVGGETISPEAFDRAYRTLYRNLTENMGGKFDEEMLRQFNLPQLALDNLVSRSLRLQAAEDMGVRVSDEEVRDSIRQVPAFQRGGGFDKEVYLRVLQLNRMTPGQFEDAQREDLLIARAEDLVRAAAQATPAEAREAYLRENDKVVLRYVGYAAKDFEDRVEPPSEDVLRAKYEETKDAYKTRPRSRVAYVEFPLEAYASAAPSEETLRERYTADIGRYTSEEQVRARHILVTLGEGEDKALEKAKAIRARLDKGESFEKVAKETSADPGSAAGGGDLGFFPRGRMVKPFEDAAFSLKPGETSEPVKSDFGYHIIRVEERKEAGVTPFEEVRDEIAAAVREEQEEQAAQAAAQAFQKAVEGGAEFKAEPPALYKETGFFASGEEVPGVGANAVFTAVATRLKPGETSAAVRVGGSHLVIKSLEVQPAAVPPFEEARDKVLEAYRKEKSAALAKEAAEAALAEVKSGAKTLDQVAEAHDAPVLETGETTPQGAYISGLGASQALKNAAFALTPEAPVAPEAYDVGGLWVIAALKERKKPTEEEIAAALPAYAKRMLERRRSEVVRDWNAALKANAKIVYNDELLKRFES